MASRRNNRKLLTDVVRDRLRQSILSGTYSPGDKLPPEPELSDAYGVSRVTLREAVRGLVEEGYLSRQHGLGTYVTEKPRLRNNLDVNFGPTQLIQNLGMTPGNRDVDIRQEEASERVAKALALEAGQPVARIERVRTADGKPIVFSVEFIPMSLLGNDAETFRNLSGSLYEFSGRPRVPGAPRGGDDRAGDRRARRWRISWRSARRPAPALRAGGLRRGGASLPLLARVVPEWGRPGHGLPQGTDVPLRRVEPDAPGGGSDTGSDLTARPAPRLRREPSAHTLEW